MCSVPKTLATVYERTVRFECCNEMNPYVLCYWDHTSARALLVNGQLVYKLTPVAEGAATKQCIYYEWRMLENYKG